VIPNFPSSFCAAFEQTFDSAVEGDNGCGESEVSVGEGHSCTITNTVYFERILTLSHYGKILLILLLAGAAFVAYRRMV
jgi:hypothetical protein